MKFRTQFTEPLVVNLLCEDPSLAQQSFKDEVDINFLLERFKVTGHIPAGVSIPQYGDFTAVTDYRTALDAVNKARDLFLALPAEIRSKFMNDPQRYLDFCSDPANLPELRKLGLAVPDKQDIGGSGAKPSDPPAGGSGEAAKS